MRRARQLLPSAHSVRPVDSQSLTERVTTELRRSILSGALAPGQAFSLREISAQLNVSFIPVREALRSLESEGLVITARGRSTEVAPLNLEDLRSIYRLRLFLEPEIASRSCVLISDDELDRLEQDVAEFGKDDLSMDEIYEAHHEFHMALLAPAATVWDMRVLKTLWRAGERYVRIGFGTLDLDPNEHLRREKAHEDLLSAFRKRAPSIAAKTVRGHLAHNEEIALDALATMTSDAESKNR